jgi:hypothetical protein
MLANPLELRGRHRVNNMNPDASTLAEGWGNSMIEAYTGNHIGHRVSRKHLKVITAP